MRTQNSRKEKSLQKKNLKNLSQKIIEQFFYQKNSRQKILPRKLWRDILC